MHENPDYLLGALKAGAAGYVLKDAPHEEIIEAVRRVRDGESPLDPELAARLLRRLASEGRCAQEQAVLMQPLTRWSP
jgi:two-component system response regulator DegU